MVRPAAGIGSVLETCLYAIDLERTARFYEDVLGLEVFARAEDRHVFFRTGAGMFLLFNPERTSAAGGEAPKHGAKGAGHVAFAVRADDMDHWRSYLQAHGIAIEAEVTWPAGGASIYLRDPAGNSIELASPKVWAVPEGSVFGPRS